MSELGATAGHRETEAELRDVVVVVKWETTATNSRKQAQPVYYSVRYWNVVNQRRGCDNSAFGDVSEFRKSDREVETISRTTSNASLLP
jgi:hypothetical protein